MSVPKQYQVTLYAQVAVRTQPVEAKTPEEAYTIALEVEPFIDNLFRKNLGNGPFVLWTEYAGEINGGLVDVVGDEQYAQTVFLNTFGNQEVIENACHCSCPELTVAASNLSIVMRSLGDDWLTRKLQFALDEIRDVAAVIRNRDNEDDRSKRQGTAK